MRVAFVINSLGAGGTERSTAVLLPYLRDRGVEPVVICLLHRDEGDEQAVIDEGFAVHIVGPQTLVGRVRAVRRLLRELEPDVVHTAIFDADVVGRLAAARTGLAVLSSLVNTPYDPARRDDPNVVARKLEAVRQVDRWTGRFLTHHFHAVTEGVAAHASEALGIAPSRITVVERGRDPEVLGRRSPERRARVRRSLGLGDRDQLVLAVGRHEFQKAHELLVEAVARLGERRPYVVVAIAGRSGNASGIVERAIDEHGVRERVRLLGHRDDVADLLVAADVFVMPSRYEGTAGAAIEALALETPIVATRLAGTEGLLVDGDNAVLVPVGDVGALADAIDRVLDDPAAARSRADRGRAMFDERFTLDRSADGMVALYDRLVRRPSSPSLASSPESMGASEPEPRHETPLALSVILCVRNGAETMGAQLDALLAQHWDQPWEILIVDNGSTDGTAAVASGYAAGDPRVRLVDASGKRGLSYARNVGVARARGRAVAFCDDDDRVGEGWVAAIGQALAEHPVVASRMEYEALNSAAMSAGRAEYQGHGIETLFGYPIVNGASGWHRDLWLELGGNDENLDISGEDIDLAIRAHLEHGIQPYFAADAVYHCRRRTSGRATFRQARRYGRAHVELHARYGRGRPDGSEPLGRVLRQWAWLVRHVADAWDPEQRIHWAWRAGLRLGRIEGRVRRGVQPATSLRHR